MKRLLLALPKGSLQDATLTLMAKAGYPLRATERSYVPAGDDPELEVRLLRAQEISRYVERGIFDAGLTGYDWIVENASRVIEVTELVYAKQGFRPVRWVVAVPVRSGIRRPRDLNGKRIATEAVRLTQRYLRRQRIRAQVEFSWGATEVKPPEMVDAIVELTETGSSLRAHNLRILDVVLESTPRLVANTASWKDPWKRRKMEELALLLKGVLAAENKVLLKMNAPANKAHRIAQILPALQAPTISSLDARGWVAIETVVEESKVRVLIPRLKRAGAQGIIELELNKLVL